MSAGCIDVVGCLSREELSQVKSIPDSVKLELMSEYGFLCENAQVSRTISCAISCPYECLNANQL